MVYLAKALQLRDGDRGALEALTRGKDSTAALALRARTVLLAADGVPNFQIEKITGFSAPTVLKWRNRYAEGGIEALADIQRPGREREIDEIAVIADTLTNDGNPPEEFGDFALVRPHYGPTSWRFLFLRCPDLAPLEDPAAPDRDVQVLH